MENKEEKKSNFLSKISDNTKIMFFRWWLVGAIYFFIAWGTNLGLNSDAFDLIFILGVVTAGVHIILFDPIIYGFFEVERKGKIVNKKYYERTILEGAWLKILEFFRCFISTILVFLVYQGINYLIIKFIKPGYNGIPLKGEPIIYATFFVIFYYLLLKIEELVVYIFGKIKKGKNKE